MTGKAKFTPDGYEIGDKGLVYLDAQESGDGRVTLQSALLPGVRTWSLDCAHGDLPDEEDAFDAYRELLEKGTTQLLSLQPTEAVPATRGGATLAAIHVPSRPSRERVVPRPPEIEREILSVPALDQAAAGAAPPRTALRISVMNGDLTYIRQPLLLGHYRSERLFGTEAAMNKLTGDVMQEALALGLYPDAPGSLPDFPQHRRRSGESLAPAAPRSRDRRRSRPRKRRCGPRTSSPVSARRSLRGLNASSRRAATR